MGSGTETAYEPLPFCAGWVKSWHVENSSIPTFSRDKLLQDLPVTCKVLTVLDRCKEPGAVGEPLYQAISACVMEAFNDGKFTTLPRVIGGRLGLVVKSLLLPWLKLFLMKHQNYS